MNVVFRSTGAVFFISLSGVSFYNGGDQIEDYWLSVLMLSVGLFCFISALNIIRGLILFKGAEVCFSKFPIELGTSSKVSVKTNIPYSINNHFDVLIVENPGNWRKTIECESVNYNDTTLIKLNINIPIMTRIDDVKNNRNTEWSIFLNGKVGRITASREFNIRQGYFVE